MAKTDKAERPADQVLTREAAERLWLVAKARDEAPSTTLEKALDALEHPGAVRPDLTEKRPEQMCRCDGPEVPGRHHDRRCAHWTSEAVA